MQREFTAVYVPCEGWWAAYVEEVPGVNSQGRTIEDARANLRDALSLMLESLARDSKSSMDGAIRESLVLQKAS